jgi:hypothetical protein
MEYLKSISETLTALVNLIVKLIDLKKTPQEDAGSDSL